MGTTWDGCIKKLASEGTPIEGNPDARTRQLYAVAWKNLRADPEPFLMRLMESAQTFATEYPSVMWKGYGRAIGLPEWLFPNLLAAVSVIGLLYGAARRAKAVELTFWALFWTSIVASSAIIYLEDGQRVLAASHPMMALFFAFGMSNLAAVPEDSSSDSRLSRNGFIGLITAAALFVCVPWMAHRFSPVGASATPLKNKNEAYVFGGRRMSGFLVIKNEMPLRNDIPSLHLSDFEAFVGLSGVENYQDLIHPLMPSLPFGFVFAPRLETGGSSGSLYIVPPEVVEHRDVAAWHFKLKRWGYRPGGEFWFYVTKAEPWP
jgi:hypothetical protein